MIGITVEKVSGIWIARDETGATIASSTPTYGIQEALNYQATTHYPVHIYSLGRAEPFNINNETINVPAGFGHSVIVHGGGWFNFDNSGTTKPGFSFDTQQIGAFLNTGGLIMYKGNWSAVQFKPETLVQGLMWSSWYHYDFGGISSIAGTGACIYIDASQKPNDNQELASSFVDNKLYANNLTGSGQNYANLQLASLAHAQQVVSENLFDFGLNSNALSAEIYIGNPAGNSLDAGLGANHYKGIISHTKGGSGYPIITNGALGWYDLNCIGVYNGTRPYYVFMGPDAYGNNFNVSQKFGATSGDMTGGVSTPFPNIFKRP